MLKRQRQPSSPSPSSSTPVFSNEPIVDLIERDSKRRRTLPPVLDGAVRGWAKPERVQYEDDEEDCSDEEDVAFDGSQRYLNLMTQSMSEYKSTNTMLRDLHTLHQHRLLFASPSLSIPNSLPSSHTSDALPSMSHQSPIKNYLPPQLERLRPINAPISRDKGSQGERRVAEEAVIVAERYENTNRLLGSLFLSRRRAIDPSSDTPGT